MEHVRRIPDTSGAGQRNWSAHSKKKKDVKTYDGTNELGAARGEELGSNEAQQRTTDRGEGRRN